jgi:hypothetical protein
MRNIKLTVGLIAALSFSIAMTASASASSFLSSGRAKLLSENVSPQKFVFPSFGSLECAKAAVTAGESPGHETSEQLVVIHYEECAFITFNPATFGPVDYVFLANGLAHISKLVRITIFPIECEIVLPAQLVSKFGYKTVGHNLSVEPEVEEKLLYTVHGINGHPCQEGTFSNGIYKGHFELMIPGLFLAFMP